MICERCSAVGKKSVEIMTQIERMFILSASIAMLRSIQSGRNDSNDLIVANSVITKMLLSFEESSRHTLVNHFKQSLGVEIVLGSCPHGISVVS